MLALARTVIERNSFASVAQPVLDRLSRQWGVTAIGVEVAGLDYLVVVDAVTVADAVQLASRRRQPLPGADQCNRTSGRRVQRSAVERDRAGLQETALAERARSQDVARRGRSGSSQGLSASIAATTSTASRSLQCRCSTRRTACSTRSSRPVLPSQLDGPRSIALAKQMQAEAQSLSESVLANG